MFQRVEDRTAEAFLRFEARSAGSLTVTNMRAFLTVRILEFSRN